MTDKNKSNKPAKAKPKANALRPAMREKKRYLAFEIISEKPLGVDADRQLIRRINDLLGVFKAADAGVMRVKYDQKTQRGLIRVERSFVDYVRACFVMTRNIAGIKVAVRTLRVSGMLNKAADEVEKINVQKVS